MARPNVPIDVEPLEPGQMVMLKGIPTGDGFSINLQSDNDVGFHLSARYNEKKFVLNNSAGGEWGKEETHKMSLKPEEPVDIRVRAQKEDFQIYVNGEEAFLFAYRAPLSALKTLKIGGEINITDLAHGKGGYYSMPLEKELHGLGRGGGVRVNGFIDKKCKGFVINLKKGNDIAFHFNPRFNEKAVVRNHCQGDTWGEEDREGEFPFKQNRVFDVVIHVGDGNYRVEVNGEAFCIFRQAMDPGSIDKVTIEGDVEVHNLQHT